MMMMEADGKSELKICARFFGPNFPESRVRSLHFSSSRDAASQAFPLSFALYD